MDISKLADRLSELNASSGGSGGGGMDFYNIKDGRNVMRILPPAEGKDMFFEEVWVHYGIGKTTDDTRGQMVICPKTQGDHKPCPVCELADEYFKKSSKKDDKFSKLAREMRKKKRVYYNVLPKDDDFDITGFKLEGDTWVNADGEEESPVKVMSTGVMVLKQILGIIVDPEYGDITNPETGLDAIITKTGSGFDTTYETRTKRKDSPIGFDQWKEALIDLSRLTKEKSYDEILSILSGDTVEEEDKEEDKAQDYVPAPATDSVEDDDLENAIKAALARRQKEQ